MTRPNRSTLLIYGGAFLAFFIGAINVTILANLTSRGKNEIMMKDNPVIEVGRTKEGDEELDLT